MVKQISITMDEDQIEWVKKNFINLSAFVRQKIALEQQKEVRK